MIRSFALTFVVGLLAVSTLTQSALTPSQTQTAPPSESLGHIFFTVKDKNGNLLSAPPKDEMELRVAGLRVEIEEVRSVKTSPLFFSVLVDVSGSSHAYEQPQDALAIELFRALSTGHNAGYLILFGQGTSVDDQPDDVLSVETTLKGLARKGMTDVYGGVADAASRFASTGIPEDSPKAIFILSDGDDNVGHESLKGALETLQHREIPIFSFIFTPYGPPTIRGWNPLEILAGQTGGSTLWQGETRSAQDAAEQMAGLASSRYMMSFKLPALKPGRSYDLRIDSSDKNAHFSAQKQYFLQ